MSTGPPPKTHYNSINPNREAQLGNAVVDTYTAVVDADDTLDEDAAWLREQRLTHKSLHWLRRPSVVMIGVSLFLFAFATASAESTRQMVTFKLACNYIQNRSHSNTCDATDTQVLVSGLQQAYAIAAGATTMFASGKIGPLSDRYGRKPFIVLIAILQITGKFSRYLVMTKYPELHFGAMVMTEIVANLCGGVITLVTLASCYVSDIAEAHQRTYYLGINIALLFVGLSVGPLAGNLLLSLASKMGISSLGSLSSLSSLAGINTSNADSTTETHTPALSPSVSISSSEMLPLRVEIAILCIVLLFVMLVLPESRSENARRKSRSLSRSLLLSSLHEALDQPPPSRFFLVFDFLRPLRLLLYPKDLVSRTRHMSLGPNRVAVVILAVADCIMTSISMPMGEIYVLYGIFRFGWNAQDLGRLLAVACSTRAFSLIVISPLLSRRLFQNSFGLKINPRRFDHVDFAMTFFAFLCEVLGMFLLSIAPKGWIFLSVLALTSLGSLASPALNLSIVKFFPELKIGELFGALAIVKNVLQIVCPVAILGIYKFSLTHWQRPQLVFVAISAVFLVGAVGVTYVIRVLDKEEGRVEAQASREAPEAQEAGRIVVHHRNASFS